MSVTSHKAETEEAAHGTLGSLLYADRAKERIDEENWRDLVRAIAAGDQLALRALYDRMNRIVFTLTMRITGDRHAAEELTLDVFHEVWQRASAYDAEAGSVVGWIMNLSRSRAIDRLRFEQRKKRRRPDMTGSTPSSASTDTRELGTERQLIENALALLSADERQAIETAFFSGLTYAEAAAHLNQPVGTIKTRIRAGLEKMRRELAKEEVVP